MSGNLFLRSMKSSSLDMLPDLRVMPVTRLVYYKCPCNVYLNFKDCFIFVN